MARVRSPFPLSLLLLPVTGFVYLLQTNSGIGIFMMFMLAPLWSVVLVNAAMVGTVAEALKGYVARGWLVIPIVFYGGYYAFAVWDHATLYKLRSSNDAANSQVAIPFDPRLQALVFESGGGKTWFLQNTALGVVYSVNENSPVGYLATRTIWQDLCARIRSNETPSLQVHPLWNQGRSRHDRWNAPMCSLSMAEKPQLPQVRVAWRGEERGRTEALLPVRRSTTTVTMPNGQHYRLLGGRASPLSWIPMPVMGCSLDSGGPEWECNAGFMRNSSAIASGQIDGGGHASVLAHALGIQEIPAAERRESVPEAMLTMIVEEIEKGEREIQAKQSAELDAMIADPEKNVAWDITLFRDNPDAMTKRADAIILGLERAAAATADQGNRAADSGPLLAELLAELPEDEFLRFGPRVLALYQPPKEVGWLWTSEPLIRRVGELGPQAIPLLLDPRATSENVGGAGIEGLCRIGAGAREAAAPALLRLWGTSRDDADRDRRTRLYVAMRRIGIVPPPLNEDRRDQYGKLRTYWADITPNSPDSVCNTGEEMLRREAITQRRSQRHRF